MSVQIRNGREFPIAVKIATILNINANPGKPRSVIAEEHNMSASTVARWAAAEPGCTLSNHQHPNTAAAVKARWAAHAQIQAYNTPTVQPNGCILFQGKTYTQGATYA